MKRRYPKTLAHHYNDPLLEERVWPGVRSRDEWRIQLYLSSRRSRELSFHSVGDRFRAGISQVFHEGLKSWSCCSDVNKPVMEFDQFMTIPVSPTRCCFGILICLTLRRVVIKARMLNTFPHSLQHRRLPPTRLSN